jgi:hypothetical protein
MFKFKFLNISFFPKRTSTSLSENIKSLGIYFKYKKRNSIKPNIPNNKTILFIDHGPEGKIKLKNFCIKANITKYEKNLT